ncbi:Peptidase family M23 [Pseudomonas panipatensis]|uniref:Peptidase family M23 n=2 Tax=Pseudomonas panipatensis TaxID=428992 RepID=A0A1G8MC38_9PSED|nr:Peptidase family M23 [Pseudomonas panipatensis]SMP76716.1 Peptidase family M23 [Pseudomonas panipatensis]
MGTAMTALSPSRQALTRDTIQVVNLRRLLGACAVAACGLALLTFAAGLWLGRGLAPLAAPAPAPATAEQGDAAAERFAMSRLGELAGRLQVLEKDADYLLKTVGNHEEIARKLSAIDPALAPAERPAPKPARGAEGGVLLPPRGCQALPVPLVDIEQGARAAGCLRRQFDLLMDAVARRNADFMAIPVLRPVELARLGSPFGNRVDPFNHRLAFHSGQDFAAPSGTDIHAAAGGRVVAAGPFSSYGNRVEIDHGNGLVTRYAHVSRFYVQVGDVVMPGQRIAAVGSSGRSTGAHLHFEVLYHGDFVNPQNFLSLGDMEPADDVLGAD